MNKDKSFETQKAFWQKYTSKNLTNVDIDEINYNISDFARGLIEFQKICESTNNKEPAEPAERF